MDDTQLGAVRDRRVGRSWDVTCGRANSDSDEHPRFVQRWTKMTRTGTECELNKPLKRGIELSKT